MPTFATAPCKESILGKDLKDVPVLGAREKGTMTVGWAVLSASVRLLGFPLTEQDRAAGSCLSESVHEK